MVVGPDVAVAVDAVGAGVGFGGADVEGRGAVDGFFECGGEAGEFGGVGAEFEADGGFAVPGGDRAEEIVDEGGVVGWVGGLDGEGGGGDGGGVGRRWVGGGRTVGVGGVGGVLELEVDEAVGARSGFDAVRDFHAAGGDVTEEVPPFRVVGECRVGDAGNEAGDVEEVVDFGKIGVGEGVAGEAAEDTS